MSAVPASAFALAELRHGRAVEQYNLGAPTRALRTLHRAWRDLGVDRSPVDGPADEARRHSALAARIWITIALSESEVHSIDRGFAALHTAEQYAEQADDPAVTVLLHCQRGLIELRGGQARRAGSSLDAAVRLLDHAVPRDQANILLNRGTVALIDGRLAAARRDFERGLAIERAAGLDVERFKTLHNLGYVEFLAGDLPRALRLMDEAGQIDADVSRGVWLLDRARVLAEAGLTREADRSLADAADILRRDRLTQDLAETILERARCALVVGDVAGARRFAGQARTVFRRRGNDRWRRAAELVLLAGDLADGRPGRRLVGPARRVHDEFAAEGLRGPARAAGMIVAEAYLRAGQIDAAARTVDQVGPAGRLDSISSRLHDHYVRAQVDAARAKRPRAVRRIHRALDELAQYQASFGSIDLRTAAAVHGRHLAELDVSLAIDSGRAPAVFAAAERARAVSGRMPSVRPPADPETAELMAELRQVVEAGRGSEQTPVTAASLLRRRRELEGRIVARSWTRSGTGAAVAAAGLDTVRGELATRGHTMVTYVEAAGRLWAVVVDDVVRLCDLGRAAPVLESVLRVRADFDVYAQPLLPGGLRGAVEASLRRSLVALDAALIAPLGLRGHSVVIVSTGVLGQLPWASLPALRGVSLVVAPSATKWLACAATEPGGSLAREHLQVVAVAGPDLARSRLEAEAVGERWPGATVYAGEAATREALAAAMSSATVLHVAAHGVHQVENPLFSSLRMHDGPVFAHELDRHDTAPEHVVLSACEVGLAVIRPGDEALGLASVLLQLGTRSVVAGVARVGDGIAESTMAAYHSALVGGTDSATALATALESVGGDLAPPFVAFGASWQPARLPSPAPARR